MSQLVQAHNPARFPAYRNLAAAFLAAGLLAAVVANPAVATQDLRSPDARDSGHLAQQTPGVDLRSPDARDGARASQETPSPSGYRDLRSPDARDGGRAFPAVPSPSADSQDALSWGYLAIGGLGLIAIAGLAATMTRRRRQPVAARS